MKKKKKDIAESFGAHFALRIYLCLLVAAIGMAVWLLLDYRSATIRLSDSAYTDRLVSTANAANVRIIGRESSLIGEMESASYLIGTMNRPEKIREYVRSLNSGANSGKGCYEYVNFRGYGTDSFGETLDVSGREYFEDALAGRSGRYGLINAKNGHGSLVVYAVPVRTDKGITGVLLCYMTESDYVALYTEPIQDTFQLYIVDTEGRPVVSSFDLFHYCKTDEQRHKLSDDLIYGRSGAMFDSTRSAASYTPSEIKGWYVVAYTENNEILVQRNEAARLMMSVFIKLLVLIVFSLVTSGIIMMLKERQHTKLRNDTMSLMDNTMGGVYKAAQGDILSPYLFFSDGVASVLGYTNEEFEEKLGGNILNAVCPTMKAETLRSINNQLTNSGSSTVYFRAITKDNSTVWLSDRVRKITVGKEPLMYGMVQDVTGYKKAVETDYLHQLQYHALYDNFGDMHVEIDSETGKSTANDNFIKRFGHDNMSFTLIGSMITAGFVHRDDLVAFRLMQEAYEKKKPEFESEIRLRDVSGEYSWFNIKACMITDKQGNALKCILKFIDISERKQKEQNELDKSRIDLLTGFLRPDAGRRAVTSVITSNYGRSEYAYLLITMRDLDVMRQTLSQSCINGMLNIFAQELKRIFGSEAIAIRLDSAVIAVFLMNAEDDEALMTLAGDIVAIPKRCLPCMAEAENLRVCVGIAKGIEASAPLSQLETKARRALAKAYTKAEREGGYEFYTLSLDKYPEFSAASVSTDSRLLPQPDCITHFIYSVLDKTENYPSMLELSMRLVCGIFDIDRVNIVEFGTRKLYTGGTAVWHSMRYEGDPEKEPSRSEVINAESVSAFASLKNDYGVSVSDDTSALKDTHSWLYEYYSSCGTVSAIENVCTSERGCACLVSFERTGTPRSWDDGDIRQLALISSMTARYIERVVDNLGRTADAK